MEPTRREALRSVVSKCIPAAATALALPMVDAAETISPKAPVGMLYDATLCIGCKACVVACAEANDLPRDVSLDGLHQAPEDLNAFTKNIIKLYKPHDQSPDSFVKQQCMHCLDPACVAACPFDALWKNDGNGVVAWESSRCIGCRYCEIACPYHVPKFEWDRINPKIVKCELCQPRLAKGYEPACTSVCPTHAVIFGYREDLLSQAKGRIEQSPDKYFENRVYGEHEAGGTQVLYLSHVAFEEIGLPDVGTTSIPERLKWQKRLYKFLALPLLLYAMLASIMKKNWIDHRKEMREERRENRIEAATVNHIIVRWQRGVPVYALPRFTPFFVFLCVLGAMSIVLSAYREWAGLGPTTGMNDIYAWGIWKTFNTMVLTGLGSGGFSIGIAAWIFFPQRDLHCVMRTAVLTSLVAYFSGLVALGVDVGRPWNFYLVLMPWKWNPHSPLMEVALCMPLYACVPLFLENTPPLIERWYYTWPAFRPVMMRYLVPLTRATYPYVIALAYALPMMHQSSLGALMLLGGSRVHVLWQTPFLPLLYVWAAGFLGYACVIGVLMVSSLSWKRPLDMRVLGKLARIMSWLVLSWCAFRFIEIAVRGQMGAAFAFDRFSLLFWLEMLLLAGPSVYLLRGDNRRIPGRLFLADVLVAVGGMLYRYDPTSFAFTARPGALYFPTAIETIIAAGYVCLAIAAFILAAKYLPILPAPVSAWYDMEHYARVVHPDWKLEIHDFSHHNRSNFAN